MKKHSDGSAPRANETSPGVRALKDVWNIRTKMEREAPPESVTSDIYCVPDRKNMVPRRRRPS